MMMKQQYTTTPGVGRIDAQQADALHQKGQRLAQRAGLLRVVVLRLAHDGVDVGPPRPRVSVARRRLDPLEDLHDAGDEVPAAVPVVGAGLGLARDEVDVDDLGDPRDRGRAIADLGDAVAHLAEHAEHAHEARLDEAEVVGQRVPEGLKRGVDE